MGKQLFNRLDHYRGATWLDAEEYAYHGTGSVHDRENTRQAAALCPDGKVRTFKVGIPDTFFSIPAIGRIKGRYVSGFVSLDTEHARTHSDAIVTFTPYR